jgi:hypothetical protein
MDRREYLVSMVHKPNNRNYGCDSKLKMNLFVGFFCKNPEFNSFYTRNSKLFWSEVPK